MKDVAHVTLKLLSAPVQAEREFLFLKMCSHHSCTEGFLKTKDAEIIKERTEMKPWWPSQLTIL